MADWDRAANLRKRPDALAALLAREDARFLPLWRNKNWILRGDPPLPGFVDRRGLAALAGEAIFLGERDGAPLFAIDLPPEADPPADGALAGGDFNDLRLCGPRLDAGDFALLGCARALCHFHRHHRHCGRCGRPTAIDEGGHARACAACDVKVFPRTDPAIMALVVRGDRCLLARQPKWPPGMYSVLAGFVEPGETLEQAVVREVREEVGLAVACAAYLSSQPWPFPCSLMIGFRAEAAGEAFAVDGDEIEAARWFGKDELRRPDGFFVPPPFSLAGQLIAAFVAAP